MGHRLDRIIYIITIIYIALPIYMFLATWLNMPAAIPACILFLISFLFFFRNKPKEIEWHLTRKHLTTVLASVLILAIWLYFSGLGGFSFQNSDYQYRNAILHDLINKSWPVIYDYSAQAGQSILGSSNQAMLTYYIAYWLPAAAVGKMFGWLAANFFLYMWSLTGVMLIVYYLFRTLRNARVWSVLIMIFFSGADIIGYLIVTHGKLPGLIQHIEWWSGLQYSSNTTLLYWVFNQTIVMWLAILLIMNLPNSRSLFFLYAMLLLHGPFPFLGLLPFVLWKAYEGYPLVDNRTAEKHSNPLSIFAKWFFAGVKRAVTFENIFGGISVLLISYFYLSNNVSGGKTGTNSFDASMFLFIVFDAGLFLIILALDHAKSPLYWLCVISLLVIPFFQIGVGQDFCMRVSIPALFVIQILVQKSLFGKPDIQEKTPEDGKPLRSRKYIRIVLAGLLVIGMTVPLQEITRSVTYSLLAYPLTHKLMVNIGSGLADSNLPVLAPYGKNLEAQGWVGFLQSDSIGTLGNNFNTSGNFIGPIHDNLFYIYLARHQ